MGPWGRDRRLGTATGSGDGLGPSLASEMPGSLLIPAESSFSVEAAELEGLRVRQGLCCLRQKPGWKKAEPKAGGRWCAEAGSDPAMAFWCHESDVPFLLCPTLLVFLSLR